jgi:nucleotide-binding universal stress UspA family protein
VLHGDFGYSINSGEKVDEVMAWGRPFVDIVHIARDSEADLIVIPTHSKSGLKHTHLGSTSARVVSLAGCPELVVRHPDYEFVSL